MNTCRRCGDDCPPHDVCEDCAYDMQNERTDWGLYPIGLDY